MEMREGITHGNTLDKSQEREGAVKAREPDGYVCNGQHGHNGAVDARHNVLKPLALLEAWQPCDACPTAPRTTRAPHLAFQQRKDHKRAKRHKKHKVHSSVRGTNTTRDRWLVCPSVSRSFPR